MRVEPGGQARAVIGDGHVEPVADPHHPNVDRARCAIGEPVFQRIGHRFGQDQRDRNRAVGRQLQVRLDLDGAGDTRLPRRIDQFRRQVGQEPVERQMHIVGAVKLALQPPDRLQFGDRIADRLPRGGIGDGAPLQRQHRADHLQVVGDAMLQFVEQQFGPVGQHLPTLPFVQQPPVGALHPVDQRDVDRHHPAIERHCHGGAARKAEPAVMGDEKRPGEYPAQDRGENPRPAPIEEAGDDHGGKEGEEWKARRDQRPQRKAHRQRHQSQPQCDDIADPWPVACERQRFEEPVGSHRQNTFPTGPPGSGTIPRLCRKKAPDASGFGGDRVNRR